MSHQDYASQRKWNTSFKNLKKKKRETKILCPAQVSLKNKHKIKAEMFSSAYLH